MPVIALSGWKGSGKDTVAQHLVEKHGYKQLSFAAKLKDLVASTYGVPREDLDSPTRKEMPLVNYPAIPTDSFSEKVHLMLRDELHSGYWTPRALCILEGSIKRSVFPNYWVRNVVYDMMLDAEGKYVISDMRYKSEADTLKLLIPKEQLKLVRIHRYDEISTSDPSERDLDDYRFDLILHNTKGKEELYATIDAHVTYNGTALVPSVLR